jgi:hypothetical protein
MAQLGRVNEATRSKQGVWPPRFLRFVVAAVATGKSARRLELLVEPQAGSIVYCFAVAAAACLLEAKPNEGMLRLQSIPRQATNTDFPGI